MHTVFLSCSHVGPKLVNIDVYAADALKKKQANQIQVRHVRVSHIWHLTRAGKPDNVWVLQELHDGEFSVQVFRVGFRVIAGLERLNHHLPGAPVATAAATAATSQFTAETAIVADLYVKKNQYEKMANVGVRWQDPKKP